MNVLVVGANGQIGRQVIDLLKEKDGYHPVAFVRKDEQIVDFEENKGVEARLGNLEDSVEDIKKRMKDIDAVVFTAGSGGSTGPDKTILIDMDGAIKTVEAAKEAGIDRFVIVSAYKADDRESWSKEIAHYYAAKYYADLFLMNSGLEYTIVRPGLLTDDGGTGSIQVVTDEEPENMEIPRADVAAVIVEALDNQNTINKGFDLVGGDVKIPEALKSL